ncbi:hypothetical protein [Neobacillus sp. SAB-20_R2A]|uniref:hypothetical protein n=1 Tax=Neobacillus sp. SAB-20_R2A TaxID=3120519 RepID=UPI003C6E2308
MPRLISKDEINNSEEFYERIHQVQVDYFYYWKEHTLWHKEFWLSLALAIIPWLIWFLIRKRGSEARLLLAGAFGIIVASWLDFLGIIFGLWHYSGRLLPTIRFQPFSPGIFR